MLILLRSGQIKNKMVNNRPVEPDQRLEPAQENVNFEEARGLPNTEMNFSNVMVGQSVTWNNTGAIPKIINRSAGHDRGFYADKFRNHTK